jgi:Ubiquitin carboxyl-terminal hydrolase
MIKLYKKSARQCSDEEDEVVELNSTTTTSRHGIYNIRQSCWLGAALQVILQLSVALGGLDKLEISNRPAFDVIQKLEATVNPNWCVKQKKSLANLKTTQYSLLRELIKLIPNTDAVQQHDAVMLFEGIFDVQADSRAIELTTVSSFRCVHCLKESSSVREPSLTLNIEESAEDLSGYPGLQTIKSCLERVQDRYEDLQIENETPYCCDKQERERAFRYTTGSPFLFVRFQMFDSNDMVNHIETSKSLRRGKSIEDVVEKSHTSLRHQCDMSLEINKAEFILQSVIVHTGESMAEGHYITVYREDLRANYWYVADDEQIFSLGASRSTLVFDLRGLLQKEGYETWCDPYVCTYVRSQDAKISSRTGGVKRSASASTHEDHDREGLVSPAPIRIVSGTPEDLSSTPSTAVEDPSFKKTRISFTELLSVMAPVENNSLKRKKSKKPAPAPLPRREPLPRRQGRK